mgnify:CR=1 FL=1
MRINSIAALDKNRVIGLNNDLAWSLPDDFQYFKNKTLGHPIIMGKNTYLALGKPLPRRRNIIISHQKDYQVEGAEVVGGLEEALALVTGLGVDDAFVIGGGQIYAQSLPWVDRLYLTFIDGEFEGDTYFPELDYTQWRLIHEEHHPVDERHAYPFRYTVWDRIAPRRPLPEADRQNLRTQ